MCNSCSTNDNIKIAIYLFIIVVAICVLFGNLDQNTKSLLLALAGGALVVQLMKPNFMKVEHLEDLVMPSNTVSSDETTLNVNTDDDRYSEYNNISLSRDIDTMTQRRADLVFSNDPSKPIDNSDLIHEAAMNYSSTFQPQLSQGVTASQSADGSGFNLGEPDAPAGIIKYSVPLNDFAYDLDESLARKQQHRSDMNKKAIDGAVRSTRNIYQKYFSNELNTNSEKQWWSAESTDFETDFHPYY